MGTRSNHSLSVPGDPSSSETSRTRNIARNTRNNVRTQDEGNRCSTISVLPDDVLLDIFDFYRNNHNDTSRPVWRWHILVHVCQRWRHIVFASPQRLELRILCTRGTPVRKNLGIWPSFPIVVRFLFPSSLSPDEDEVIATLEHPNRVCSLTLAVTASQFGKIDTLTQRPFPVLTYLCISLSDGDAPVLPAGFLGGSAQRLQDITLSGISFPALPTLLLSTRDLITLTLINIPQTGYISPEVMTAALAALPRLESFTIEFQSATPHPDQICPPPIARTVLPSLAFFQFQGANEYMEDLVARLDGPQLVGITIVYLNHLLDFQVAQLSIFLKRSVGIELTPPSRAHVCFHADEVDFTLYRHANCPGWDRRAVRTTIFSDAFNLRASHLAQILSRFSATIFAVVHLELDAEVMRRYTLGPTNVAGWLHVFRQFPALQTLHVSRKVAGFIALALNGIRGETVAEVLPFLELICLEGQLISTIERFDFFADRRLSDRPVTLVSTRKEFDQRFETYISK